MKKLDQKTSKILVFVTLALMILLPIIYVGITGTSEKDDPYTLTVSVNAQAEQNGLESGTITWIWEDTKAGKKLIRAHYDDVYESEESAKKNSEELVKDRRIHNMKQDGNKLSYDQYTRELAGISYRKMKKTMEKTENITVCE